MQLRGRRYDTGEPISVTIRGERVAAIEPAWPRGDVTDWPWLAPAFFDLQINGHCGTWFSDDGLTADRVIETLRPHYRYGITRLCPTLITNSFDALAAGFAAIREACEREPWVRQMVPGCHLEGPFIASEDGPRGAHPKEHVRPADFDEFARLQEISGDRIRLVTLAPEVEGAMEFIRKAVASGVVISIGHTAAAPEQITAAVEAGARLSTHLGNGAHGTLRRHPNYIWEQLGEPRLMASIISDGHHLPPSVVRTIIRTKTPRNTILTCDAAGLAGCPPGIYENKLGRFEILPDGRLVVAGQTQLLAGSAFETDRCVANAMRFAGVSLAEAVEMASRNPAKLLGFEVIRLRRGSRADFIVFDLPPGGDLNIRATVTCGRGVYGDLPSL